MMLQRVQAAHETLTPQNFAQDTAKAAKLDKPMVFSRDKGFEDKPDARAAEEAALRAKWAQRAMDIVAKAGLPINALAQDSQAPARILVQVCQGKRARTIAQRCRSWAHASRFFETAYNKPWPPHVGAVLEYIGVLAEGKGRPSRIEGFINALAFFEKRRGFAGWPSFSQNGCGGSLRCRGKAVSLK